MQSQRILREGAEDGGPRKPKKEEPTTLVSVADILEGSATARCAPFETSGPERNRESQRGGVPRVKAETLATFKQTVSCALQPPPCACLETPLGAATHVAECRGTPSPD